jgi:hypothetical protein
MKWAGAIFFLFTSHVFAVQLYCSKKVSSHRSEIGIIRHQPHLDIALGFEECTGSQGQTACYGEIQNTLVDEHSVCFQKMNVESECSVKEAGDFHSGLVLSVQCSNGSSLIFTSDSNAFGRVYCLENGGSKKSWELGKCQEE